MRYMLRRVILEQFWQRQLDELVSLCKGSGIEEVLLMEQSHQMLMVPYTIDKHHKMAAIFKKMAQRLREESIMMSINIASLTGHTDADVMDDMVLPYQKFVGEDLKEAKAVYCILDEDWQEYAKEVCSIYAKCAPDKLFIDDDFRSLNHTTAFGCFCPLHANEVSKSTGIKIDKETLLGYIKGLDDQSKMIRQVWMDINFRGQLQAARKIQEAVGKAAPDVRIGLMNSGEPAHCVQGRDISRLLLEFAGNSKKPLSRPAGGGYTDVLHDGFVAMHQTMALSMHAAGYNVETVSEVENWPHTRFTKSISSTACQMQIHALAGASSLTLNIYDYLANPFSTEPGFAQMLRENKEILSVIKEHRGGKKAVGFGLPWKKDTAKELDPDAGLHSLMPKRFLDTMLPLFGIPTQFEPAKGNAIFGKGINCFDDDEIMDLISGGLMLDPEAYMELCKRGFSRYLGAEMKGQLKGAAAEVLEANEYTGDFKGHILPTNWFRMEKEKRYITRLVPFEKAHILSTLTDIEMNDLGAGTIIYENELGGRIAVFAVPADRWQWANRARANMVSKLVRWLMYDTLPLYIQDCVDIAPFYYQDRDTGKGLLGILNAGLDTQKANLITELDFCDLLTGRKDDFLIKPISVSFYIT